MVVGIRELKARLSEYLELVAGGETVRVTHRGKPRALLIPLPEHDRLADGMRDGWIAAGPATDEPPGVPPAFTPQPGRRAADELEADRGL